MNSSFIVVFIFFIIFLIIISGFILYCLYFYNKKNKINENIRKEILKKIKDPEIYNKIKNPIQSQILIQGKLDLQKLKNERQAWNTKIDNLKIEIKAEDIKYKIDDINIKIDIIDEKNKILQKKIDELSEILDKYRDKDKFGLLIKEIKLIDILYNNIRI